MICRLGLLLKSALTSRKGVTALEYGVIAAATIVVGLATFGAIGTDLASIFTKVAAQI
jgi:Flp pilus assembly pilin Flp